MLITSDTGVIELYLTKHLKRKEAQQFELRLLRDAAFLEKVFMHKARVTNPDETATTNNVVERKIKKRPNQ